MTCTVDINGDYSDLKKLRTRRLDIPEDAHLGCYKGTWAKKRGRAYFRRSRISGTLR